MICYLDASTLSALVLNDASAPAVAAVLVRSEVQPVVSDFGWGELISAIGARVRARSIRRARAARYVAMAEVFAPAADRVAITSDDLAKATAMLTGFDLALRLPDAIHIAIAHRYGAMLVSADRQQVAAARSLNVDCINPLEERR